MYPYEKSYKPIEGIPIVKGATAYDDPITGTTYILVFNEALYYGLKMDHSLINPNQVRSYGIDLWDNPFDQARGLRIDVNDELTIPMHTVGTKIMFETRSPTDVELRTCHHITMTSPTTWNPERVSLGETHSRPELYGPAYRIGRVTTTDRYEYEYADPTSDEAHIHGIDPSLTDLKEQLLSKINRGISTTSSYDPDFEDAPDRRTFVSTDRHTQVNADTLAERFCIGPERARATLRATTQRGMRSAILPISRRYRADRMFDVKRLHGKFATDTLWSKTKSLRSNVASQIYTHKCGFNAAYHLQRADGEQVGHSLANFIHEFGAPEHLTFDGASVQVGAKTKFMEILRRAEIKYHISAPRRPNENPAEASIREIKKRWYRIMQKLKVPPRLWDYGITWVCETSNVTVSSSRYAEGRTPLEVITGITPDITEYLDFGFYDWVVYKSNAGVGPPELGRWLGVSHRVGQLMTYWILPESGIAISCGTVQRLTRLEQQKAEWQSRMKAFEDKLSQRFDAASSDITANVQDINPTNILDLEGEDQDFIDEYSRVIDDAAIKHADDAAPPSEVGEIDPYLGMELGLPRGDDATLQHATVKKRAVDDDGTPVGHPSTNPILDSRQYEVEFLDGTTETLAANVIAENLLAQVDEEGHRQLMMDEIMDHRVLGDAIPRSQGTYTTASGTVRKKRTTRGWEMCVRWKDGSHDWVALKDLKESYPVQLAEYATNNRIHNEPAFAWWVPYVKRKRAAMISKLKSKYWQRTHKYGIRIPKSVDEARRIDEENGDTLWMDAVRLEMANVRMAFEEYEGDPADLIGYQEITGHMVFDVKLGENFRRKARYCADGHKTETPASVTYSTVVSRDSVRIILTIAALNELDVLGADIQNAYLTAPNREKCWMRAGPEFGADQGKVFIVVRALYGLKSAGASFRAFISQKLDEMGFKSSMPTRMFGYVLLLNPTVRNIMNMS